MHIKTYVPSLTELIKFKLSKLFIALILQKIIHKQHRSYSMVLLNATYMYKQNKYKAEMFKTIIKEFSQSSKNSWNEWR